MMNKRRATKENSLQYNYVNNMKTNTGAASAAGDPSIPPFVAKIKSYKNGGDLEIVLVIANGASFV